MSHESPQSQLNQFIATEHYRSLANGYRAVFIAESLLREFLRHLLYEAKLDVSKECAVVLKGGLRRFIPSGAIGKTDELEACTFGELIQILFGGPSSTYQRFNHRIHGINPKSLRAMLELARETRNAVTHFWPLSQDSLANVREVSRYLILFLNKMNVSSSRIEDLARMYRQEAETEQADFKRRYLACAAIALPDQEVISDMASHLSYPDPETAAIVALPNILGPALGLRSTILFSQNVTQAFRATLEVIRFHDLDHHSRAGEEGLFVSRTLLNREEGSWAGTILLSDVEHPSIVHMARAVWPQRLIAAVKISDLLFRTRSGGPESSILEEIIHRYLSAIGPSVSGVVIPHVTWINGAKLDIVSLCKTIRERYPLVTTIVDGAQAVGHIPLNVETCDKENETIDFYLGCGHKWLGGPETVGFVRVGRRFIRECLQCLQYLASNDQVTNASGVALNYEGEQIGTNQRGLGKGFLRALRQLPQHESDLEKFYHRIRQNADRLRAIIGGYHQLEILDPVDGLKSGIVAFTLRDQNEELLSMLIAALKEKQFTVAVYPLPAYLKHKRVVSRFVRLSPRPSLTEMDFDLLEQIFRTTLI